jgi:hypothetical protein
MKDTAKIVSELVSAIDKTIVGTFDVNLNLTLTCKTKWLRVGKIVTNSTGDKYTITEIVNDVSIKGVPLSTSAPNLTGIITLPPPFYISGTHMATNNEWTKASSNLMNKTPLAWLLETITMEKFGRGDTRDFQSEVRLFFLDETDVVNYYTLDHRTQVVEPMEELALAFIESVNLNRKIKTIEEYSMVTFSRFGVEGTEGMFKNILDANLSGVELKISLTKYKEDCKC